MYQGLTNKEVVFKTLQGQNNIVVDTNKRKYADIIKENTFTFINILLGVISVLLIIFGKLSDGVIYFWVAVLNILVSIFQEINAKMKLDKISHLIAPQTLVIRDGGELLIDSKELVVDDILILKSGEIVSVDCVLLEGTLSVDESILTGESNSVNKNINNEILCGSVVVSGFAYCKAIRVGNNTVSAEISSKAKKHKIFLTPIQREVNLTIRILSLIALTLGLMVSMYAFLQQTPLSESIQVAAVIVGVIPNSLFAMINLAYALGSVSVLQKGALVQKLNAIESLANVDVLCLDKTGTLTTKDLCVEEIIPVADYDVPAIISVLNKYSNSFDDKNATLSAIKCKCTESLNSSNDESEQKGGLRESFAGSLETLQFDSKYKWAGILLSNHNAVILGAGDILINHLMLLNSAVAKNLQSKIEHYQNLGFRVLALCSATNTNSLFNASGDAKLPNTNFQVLSLIIISDKIRENVLDSIVNFQKAGVEIKIISGDNQNTVYALAKQMGVFSNEGIKLISGEDITDENIDEIALNYNIFGRITPIQKESIVRSLIAQNKYVAMIGDGVNDVMSLKIANIGISMESGSSTTKSVSDLVLLNDSFASLPSALIEGQKIKNGLINIFKLYLTRIMYKVMLFLSIFAVGLPFPFTVKQSSLIAFFSAALPAIGLSLWTNSGKTKKSEGLIKSVLSFVIPASIITGIFAVLILFGLTLVSLNFNSPLNSTIAISDAVKSALVPLQTSLVIFLIVVSQILTLYITPPTKFFAVQTKQFKGRNQVYLSLGIFFAFGVLYSIPAFRHLFEISLISFQESIVVAVCVLLWWISIHLTWKFRLMEKFLSL